MTISPAIKPPAPGRLSMMICLPHSSVRRAATMRAMTSFDAPGAKPTSQRMGLLGNPGAGSAGAAAALAAAQKNDSAIQTDLIDVLLFRPAPPTHPAARCE